MPIRELKWGLAIGLANLAWLYATYYAGLHTGGIVLFQLVPLGWFVLTVAGFVLALRDVKRRNPALRYGQGLRAGLVIAAVTAVVAVVMQVGYFTLIHPGWPAYMAEQTRAYYAGQGLPMAGVAARVEAARARFSLASYAVQSAAGALVLGTLASAVILLFLRREAPAA